MPGPIAEERHAAVDLLRVHAVPLVSTMAGSAVALLPLVANWPALPPFGLLMLLAWRLLRPELWPAWVALPLGLFDDLMTGLPVGTAMFLWTASLLLLDMIDSRFLWRDYWIDWIIATVILLACRIGTILLSGVPEFAPALAAATMQMLLAVLCFPILMRLCLRLDRWRLGR